MHKLVRTLLFVFALLIVGVAVTAAAEVVTMYTIDFEEFDAGDIADVVNTGAGPVNISTGGDADPVNNPPMIFDAECPGGCTGNDGDLEAPGQGKVLIASEDGNASDPDDLAGDSIFTFDFSELDCAHVEIVSFSTIDATDTNYRIPPGVFVNAGFGDLNDNGVGTLTFPSPVDLPEKIFEVEVTDSGAVDDVKFNCINDVPDVDSFLKFDPAAQSIFAGEGGFNFHLQMGNPGGEPEVAWAANSAFLVCNTQPLEDAGLVIDESGINKGLFGNVDRDDDGEFDFGDNELVLRTSQQVPNGQFFDVNIPADTSGLATGDYELDCWLVVAGAETLKATFELNIRTEDNQDGGPVDTDDAMAYIQFNSSNPVNSNANQWYDTLYVNVQYGNLTDVTITDHEIVCTLSTSDDAAIIDAQAWGGFNSVAFDDDSAEFTDAQSLQNFQNRNLQIVIDGLYDDTDTELECTLSYPQGGGTATEVVTLGINN